jgi:hypothetical protein
LADVTISDGSVSSRSQQKRRVQAAFFLPASTISLLPATKSFSIVSAGVV